MKVGRHCSLKPAAFLPFFIQLPNFTAWCFGLQMDGPANRQRDQIILTIVQATNIFRNKKTLSLDLFDDENKVFKVEFLT